MLETLLEVSLTSAPKAGRWLRKVEEGIQSGIGKWPAWRGEV